MRSTCSSMMLLVVQSARQPAATRKLRSMAMPCSVCMTSGWNCIPYMPSLAFSAAATGVPDVLAVTVKPSGATVQVSPCDIQTCCAPGRPPSKTPPGSATASAAAPYSPDPVLATSPPRSRTISWNP